jgi:NADPH-ferrihemoprotein reductase
MTTAFSRPTTRGEKRYVQNAIWEEKEGFVELLVEQNAYFYICGSAGMAREVSDVVNRVLGEMKAWSEAEVKGFVERQKRQRRWLQDVWG